MDPPHPSTHGETPIDDPAVEAFLASALRLFEQSQIPQGEEEPTDPQDASLDDVVLEQLAWQMGLSQRQEQTAREILKQQISKRNCDRRPPPEPVTPELVTPDPVTFEPVAEVLWIPDESLPPSPGKPPPIPRQTPPPVSTARSPEGIEFVSGVRTKSGGRSGASPPPPPLPAQRDQSSVGAQDGERQKEFMKQAARIIALYRGWNPQSRSAVLAAARDWGLSAEQAEQALYALQPGQGADGQAGEIQIGFAEDSFPVEAPIRADPQADKGRPVVKGVPPPIPPLPPQASLESPSVTPDPKGKALALKPAEAFTNHLAAELSKFVGRRMSASHKKQFIRTGVEKYSLSEVYAQHLVEDAMEQRGWRLAKRFRSPSTPTPQNDSNPQKEKFLERAAQIISEERGINVKSRVKLALVAEQLGFSGEETESLLASLQSTGEAEDPQQQERLAAYQQYLQKKLGQQDVGILTLKKRRHLVQTGQDYYGVEKESVEAALREAAAQAKVRVISEEQALEHIQGLIDQQLGEATRIRHDLKGRIVAEGRQWGLEEEEIEEALASVLQRNQDRFVGQSRRNRLLLRGVGAIGLALAIVLGWGVFFATRQTPNRPDDALADSSEAGLGVVAPSDSDNGSASASSAEQQGNNQSPNNPANTDWMDVNLVAEMALFRSKAPKLKGALDGIRSGDPQRRARMYQSLLGQAADLLDKDPHAAENDDQAIEIAARDKRLLGIVAGCYALDPASAAAEQLAAQLMRWIPTQDAPALSAAVTYRTYWAVQAAVAAMAYKGISPSRAQSLAQRLGKAIDETLDREQELEALQNQCFVALSRHLFRNLTATADEQPENAAQAHAALRRQSRLHLSRGVQLKLDAEFLSAVLPRLGDNWSQFKGIIQLCAGANDPLVVLKMVEALETADNVDLQDFLKLNLLSRVKLVDRFDSVVEAARAVRSELGVAPGAGMSESARWRVLQLEGEKALAAKSRADRPVKLLEEVLELAHYNTMAAALTQGEVGFAVYDQLREQQPTTLQMKKSVEPVALPDRAERPPVSAVGALRGLGGASPSQRTPSNFDDVKKFLIRPLVSPANRRSASRTLSRLSVVAPRIPELDGEAAEWIADFILFPRSRADYEAMQANLPMLLRWKYVWLALADKVDDDDSRPWVSDRLRRQRVKRTLEKILGHPIEADDPKVWRQNAQRELLSRVIQQLPATEGSLPDLDVAVVDDGVLEKYDVASEALAEYYRTSARLFGLPPLSYRQAQTPAELLRLLIDHLPAQLKEKKLDDIDEKYLAELPHRLAAVEYLSGHDLRAAVLLQRIWLHLTAMSLQAKRPDRAEAAQKLIEELEAADIQADNLLIQLRDGEAWLLRLRLLWR